MTFAKNKPFTITTLALCSFSFSAAASNPSSQQNRQLRGERPIVARMLQHSNGNVLTIDGTFESNSPLGTGNVKSKWGTAITSIETESGPSGNKYLLHHDRQRDDTVLYIAIDKSKVRFGQDYKFVFRYKTSAPDAAPKLNHWMAVRTSDGKGCWIDTHLKGLTCIPEHADDGSGDSVPTGWSKCESFVNIGLEHKDPPPGMTNFGLRFNLGYEASIDMHYDDMRLELGTPPPGVKTAASVANCQDVVQSVQGTDFCEGSYGCPNPCGAAPEGDLYMPHCEETRMFIQCEPASGRCFEQKCPEGTVWDDIINACTHSADWSQGIAN